MEDVNVPAEVDKEIRALKRRLTKVEKQEATAKAAWAAGGRKNSFLKQLYDATMSKRKRLESLIKDLQRPYVFNKRVMQALKELKDGQNKLEKRLHELVTGLHELVTGVHELKHITNGIKETLENVAVSIPGAILARIEPLIVGIIDPKQRAHCVGVGSFVGTRLILTAYHNLTNQNTYEFRTPDDVESMVKYRGTLLDYNAKDDWALLQSDKAAPDFLEVCEVTEKHKTHKVVTLGFGANSTDVGFMEASTIAADPRYQYSIEIQSSYITRMSESVLHLDTGGISGSAVVFTCDGKIMGMHVNKHNNVKALPPSPDDDEDDPQASGKKRSSNSAAASVQHNIKRQKHTSTSPENIKRFARSVSDSTSHEAMVLIVSILKNKIDSRNKKLAGELESTGHKRPRQQQ